MEFALRDARDNPRPKGSPAGRPSALVVAPTRELALQVAGVCNKLRRSAPVRCVTVYGGASQEEQQEQAWGSRFTLHASRFTLHASRFTLHASRFTLHASR